MRGFLPLFFLRGDNMITLYKNFNYDNNYDYVKTFGSREEQQNFFNSLSSLDIDNTNYIKTNKEIRVEYDYDFLTESGYNYLSFKNDDRIYYCFITEKEYIREDLTKIYVEIDVFQTFLFDFTLGKSFVERKVCSLSEITDFDEGIEMGDYVVEYDKIMIEKNYTLFAMFTGFKDYYVNEKGDDIKEFPLQDISRPYTKIDGISYPLLFLALDNDFNINTFYQNLSDLPNLVGIIRVPNCSYTVTNFAFPLIKITDGKMIKNYIGLTNVVTSITSSQQVSGSVGISKSSLFDLYPYTFYVLTDGESEPLLLQPQYCLDSISITGKYAISHSPVERYYPNYYKGSTNGKVYNITNTSVMTLPTGNNNLGDIYNNLNSYEQNNKNNYLSAIVSSGIAGASLASGNAIGAVTGLVSAYTSLSQNLARQKDVELTPSSIKSWGNPSTRKAFGNDSVRLIKYTIQDKYKNRISNFISRYGNKYNNYANIDLKFYKGYLKMCDVKINSKLDNIYINKINEILERGVYFE